MRLRHCAWNTENGPENGDDMRVASRLFNMFKSGTAVPGMNEDPPADRDMCCSRAAT